MKISRFVPLLLFLLLAGCMAETYPGVVVGNPEVDEETSAPGTAGERPDFDFPDGGSYEDDDSSAPGSIDKEPEEEDTADTGDQDVSGSDRIGEPEESEDPEPAYSRPEHAEYDEPNWGDVIIQGN